MVVYFGVYLHRFDFWDDTWLCPRAEVQDAEHIDETDEIGDKEDGATDRSEHSVISEEIRGQLVRELPYVNVIANREGRMIIEEVPMAIPFSYGTILSPPIYLVFPIILNFN